MSFVLATDPTDALQQRLQHRFDNKTAPHGGFFTLRSDEAGHGLLRAQLVKPLFELEFRVNEGSSATLARSLLESAVRLLNELASFESARACQASKTLT